MEPSDAAPLQRVYPAPAQTVSLKGVYLQHALHRSGPLVYANFIASLDGRVALADAKGAIARMPAPVLNARDWRLYQELIAQADVVLVSRGYLRFRYRTARDAGLRLLDPAQDHDLLAWRLRQGLRPEPALAVVTRELALPEELVRAVHPRPLYIVTTEQASAARVSLLERVGAKVLRVGTGPDVQGTQLINALRTAGFDRICSVAGPRVLHLLLQDDCLDRLYLTVGLRILGGAGYATLVEGGFLQGAPAFDLESLYWDAPSSTAAGQLFGVYTRARS